MNSVLKKVVDRAGDLCQLDRAILSKVQDGNNKSQRWDSTDNVEERALVVSARGKPVEVDLCVLRGCVLANFL